MKSNYYLVVLLLSIFSTTSAFTFIPGNSEKKAIIAQEYSLAIVELLQDGESYSIEITSLGCFHGTRQTLIVSNEAGIISANFQESSKTLSEKDIEAIITFELQLRDLELGGCTTVDTYVLRYGNEKFHTSDGTCSWNGGKKLLQKLGYA